MTAPNIVLWVYIVLLVAGGLVGFLKAGSKASLIMSSLFALPLALCALGILNAYYDRRETVNGKTSLHIHFDLADALVLLLLCFFTMRWIKGRKFMPAGLMVVASVLTLGLRQLLLK